MDRFLEVVDFLCVYDIADNRRDLRACAEIIKSCSELDMPLSEIQNEQFLGLFINQNESDKARAPLRRDTTKGLKQFQYKF